MAMMCTCALLLPPATLTSDSAFKKLSRVRMREGRRSSYAISTMRRPVSYAICPRSRYGAGMAAQPGNDRPSASATAFMVEAVPMVLQCPAEGALLQARCKNSSSSISPAASWRRLRQITVPEPTS